MRVLCIENATVYGIPGPLKVGAEYNVDDIHLKGEKLQGWVLHVDYYHLEEFPNPEWWFAEVCFIIIENTEQCQITEKQYAQ